MHRLALIVLLLPWSIALASESDEDAQWRAFRTHCLDLLKNLETLKYPLPPEDARTIRDHLAKVPANKARTTQAILDLLDTRCLVLVHINPESRVKAARGSWKADLRREHATHVLVRVHNEAGVTHPLAVVSDQAVVGKQVDAERWLRVAVVNEKPFANKLTGQTWEYRLMRLTALQAGKREATLAFDVGQGTQDLGFRAEVPILFTVRER